MTEQAKTTIPLEIDQADIARFQNLSRAELVMECVRLYAGLLGISKTVSELLPSLSAYIEAEAKDDTILRLMRRARGAALDG